MRLKLHEFVEIEVIERLSGGSFIVNVDGALLRVRTLLDSRPQPGDRLRVKVVALDPLQFQTVRNSKLGLDVEV